jgi:MYND finger
MPPWRAKLMEIAPDHRTKFQEELVWDVNLADQIKQALDDTSEELSLDDPGAFCIMAWTVESYLTGPFEYTAIELLGPSVRTKLLDMAYRLYRESIESTLTHRSLPEHHVLPAALAHLVLSSIFVSCQDDWDKWHTINFMCYQMADMVYELDWEEVDKDLDDACAALCAPQIHDALIHVHHAAECTKKPHCMDCVIHVLYKIILPAAEDDQKHQLPTWKALAVYKCILCILRCIENAPARSMLWGVRLGGSREALKLLGRVDRAHQAVMGIFERGLAAAQASKDAGQVAFYAGRLASLMTMSLHPIAAERITAVTDASAAALEEARPWMPRTMRRRMDVSAIGARMARAPHLLFHSIAYEKLAGKKKCSCCSEDGLPALPAPPAPLQLRTCAACGTQSKELMACGGCRAVFFCSKACQKATWKTHKKECARLKASDEKTDT